MFSHTDIEFLYCFSSHGIYFIEAKRTDLTEDSPPHLIYYWLRLDADTNQVTRLEFVGMESEDGVDVREFTDGVLSFDHEIGEFLGKDGTGIAMDRIAKNKIPKAIKKLCVEAIQNLN